MPRRFPKLPDLADRPHLVCFHCRKCFKPAGAFPEAEGEPARTVVCPDCKQPMTRLGRYFRAPPRSAVRHWHKVELLHRFGESFDVHGTLRGKRGTLDSLRDAIEHLVLDRKIPEDEVRRQLAEIRDLRRDSDALALRESSPHDRSSRRSSGPVRSRSRRAR